MEIRDKRYEDVRLIFKEENHKYTDTLGNEYKSTTTLLHSYAKQFDREFWLKQKARELHTTPEKLAQQWDAITKEAQEQGTAYHNELEDGVKGVSMFTATVIISPLGFIIYLTASVNIDTPLTPSSNSL